MKNFLDELRNQSEIIEQLAVKIEGGEPYERELKEYLPVLNQTIAKLFKIIQNPTNPIEISQDFVLQVLHDILYGIEKEDTVCLADVLRYGLIEIFDYVGSELQSEAYYE